MIKRPKPAGKMRRSGFFLRKLFRKPQLKSRRFLPTGKRFKRCNNLMIVRREVFGRGVLSARFLTLRLKVFFGNLGEPFRRGARKQQHGILPASAFSVKIDKSLEEVIFPVTWENNTYKAN